MPPIALLLGIFLFVAVLIVLIWKKNLKICQPSEVLVFSGRSHRMQDGRVRGYRVIKGGSAFRWPLIEAVDRLDLTNMVIDLSVRGAYSKGGIPLNVQGVANVKIAGDEPILLNAIERFLGRSRDEILDIARETLEGNLRGVLAALTPEQVNEDKLAFAEKLLHEAEHDLSKLGIVLDNLKIQNVTDDAGYLASLGRKKSAELQKQSRITEAIARADARIRAAENQQQTSISQIESQMTKLHAQAQRQLTDAESRREALIAEEQAKVAQEVAKAKAELDVQKARVEQVRRQLEAEIIEPAKAEMAAAKSRAKGEVAKIVEDGRAGAEAFRRVTQIWRKAGPNAKDIMILYKLELLVKSLLSTMNNLQVDRLTVINNEGKNGSSIGAGALALTEELKATMGVDLAGAVRRLTGSPEPSEKTSLPAQKTSVKQPPLSPKK